MHKSRFANTGEVQRIMKRIGLWGQYGDGINIADGQAVRTTIITNELLERYGKHSIKIVNTNNWDKHPFLFLIKSIV